MRATVPLLGGRAVDKAFAVNVQRTINLRPEGEPSGAKSLLTLKPTEGLTLMTAQGNGPCRSHYIEFQDSVYWVSGSQLFAMNSAWTVTTVGSLSTTSGWCVMAAGRDYLMLVDGADGYTWDGASFATISDGDLPANPTWCAYFDGYFLANNRNSDRWSVSDLTGGNEDPTSWNALMFATAEADPDDVVTIARTYERLYLIGTRTTQVYYNSGNADFPFDLVTNGVLEWGIEAPASLGTAEGRMFMLSRSSSGGLAVIMVAGFQHQEISDPDFIKEIEAFESISDAEGYAYKLGGDTFYELTFPTDGRTFCFQVETGLSHERITHGLTRHRTRGHGYFNRRHLVGDYQNGNVYYLDPTNYTDNGYPLVRTRVTSVIHRDGREIECNALEVEFKRGVGLISGQGSDPQAMLRYSVDGGRTWSSTLWQPLGAIGEYHMRAVWQMLGQGRSFIFEISVSDPVEVIFIAAYADIEVLAA